MTRDEAMKKLAEVVHVQGGNISERSIGMSLDGYVALGMLKLDELKSPESRLAKELGWPEGGKSYSELLIALKNAGVALIDDSCRAAK